MSQKLKVLAGAVWVLACIGLSRAFYSLVQTGGAVEEGAAQQNESGLFLSIVANAWVLLLPFIFRRARSEKATGAARLLILPLLFAILVSFLAFLPVTSMKEAVRVAALFAMVVCVSRVLRPRELIKITVCVGFLLCLLSVIFAVFLPKYGVGVGVHAGAWQGVFGHKNHLGRFSALTISCAGALWAYGVPLRWRLFTIISATVALVALVGSRSGNAAFLVGGVAAFALVAKVISIPRSSLGRSVAICMVFTTIFVLVIAALGYYDEALKLFGKTSDLSGRGTIWNIALNAIGNHPVWGYGFNTYWVVQPSVVARGDFYLIPHAHNGLLESLLAVGVVGLLPFVVVTLAILRMSWNAANRFDRRAAGNVSGFYLLVNVLESNLFSANLFLALVLVVALSTINFDDGRLNVENTNSF